MRHLNIWFYCELFQIQMKSCLVVLLLMVVHSQLPNEPLPKFALLTVTYARNHTFHTIIDYLRLYAQTQCYQNLISEICIVWNNQQPPENVGAMDRQLYWRVPVYFYLTTNNSLNHRFRVPKEANAEVFYSLDDDIRVDCETLKFTYAHYISSKESNIKGIVTNEARNYGFFPNKKVQFQYQGHSYANFYSIAETGASFFPKSYLNLYYLDLQQINLLREKVDKITSCQDIFFMVIAQHFYPQMGPRYYAPSADYVNTNPSIGLSRKPGLVALRTSCLVYLTEVLGYNPLRQYSKNASLYEDNWQFPNHNIIMQTKIQGFINIPTIQSQERTYSQLPIQLRPQTQALNQLQQQSGQTQEQAKESNQKQQAPKVMNPVAQTHEPIKQIVHQPIKEQRKRPQPDNKQQEVVGLITKQFSKFELIVSILVFIILALLIGVCRLYRMYQGLKRIKDHSSLNEQQITITNLEF